MKFVFMRTTCSVSILNLGLKLVLNLLKQLVFILLCLFLICGNNELETFGATSDEIRLMAFYLNPEFIDVSLKTWVSTSDEIGIITKDLCLNCTENELQTCLIPTDGSRIYLRRRRHGKISNKLMKIVNWRSTYFLCVLIVSLNITCL